MSIRSGSLALLGSRGLFSSLRRDNRPDRWRARLVVEPLEGRMLLAGSSSPTNPVPIGSGPVFHPTPQQLGAAYRDVVQIQANTLRSLGASYRQVEAAAARLAARLDHAIPRDRRLAQVGASIATRAEEGLDVARSVEDQSANTDKIYIPNGLISSGLGTLVKQAEITGSNLVRSARRSTDAVVHKLNALDAQLAETRH